MEMKISSKNFRVKEGDEVNLKKWPTTVKPVYKSKKQYEQLLREHVAQLSSQQQLLYASSRHAVLLIFQAMDAAGKDGAIRHVMPGSTPKAARYSASSIPAPPNCNTIFSGAPRAICPNAGGSASSTDPTTREF
jgi:polyphosphate kinase 2 (PPK2 family)